MQAVPVFTLLSNTGQATSGTGGCLFDHAQAFTTCSDQRAYTLTGAGFVIGMRIPSALPQDPVYAVRIWTADASDNPEIPLGTLAKSPPGLLSEGLSKFKGAGDPASIWTLIRHTYWCGTRRVFRPGTCML